MEHMFPPVLRYMRRKSEQISKSSWWARGGGKVGLRVRLPEKINFHGVRRAGDRRLPRPSRLDFAALSGAWHRRVLSTRAPPDSAVLRRCWSSLPARWSALAPSERRLLPDCESRWLTGGPSATVSASPSGRSPRNSGERAAVRGAARPSL